MLKEYSAKIKELGIGKLLLILLAGIVLVLTGTKESNPGKDILEEKRYDETINPGKTQEDAAVMEEILAQIRGVEQAKVLITYEDFGERILISGKEQELTNSVENDSQGGNRTENTQSIREEYIYEGDCPYVIKNVAPTIRGVVVVYRGESGCIREITEAVRVLTGVDYHRIKVLTMN